MNTSFALLTGLAMVTLGAVFAVKSGLARWLFFQLHALVKGDELVGPALLHNPPVDSPYQRWLKLARNKLPVREGLILQDIEHMALQPWPGLGEGITGVYLHLAHYQMLDAQIIETPPGGKTDAQKHLYEKGIYILSGSGSTSLCQEGKPERQIAWNPGDLFSIPLNVRHRHQNTGHQPARMLMVTTFPLMLNLLDDEDFMVENPGAFTRRYDAAPGYLDETAELARLELTANLVKDVRTVPARQNDFRGKGNQSIRWQMAGNTVLSMHISEMPPRMMKKAHRITSNAYVLVLSGSGCSVLWREGLYRKRVRIDWKAGTLFAPPVFWYQQHLNSGWTPARYLAINVPGFVRNMGLHFEDQLEVDLSEVRTEWRKELENQPAEQH